MQFDSYHFAIFFLAFFALYWICARQLRIQNILIVVGSYIFYGWWDWRFLSLIIFSTLVDYAVGRGLLKTEHATKRKILLLTSILVNLGFLGVFKYYNFFVDNFIAAFSFFGTQLNSSSLSIILPVGISFYTFQTLSYSISRTLSAITFPKATVLTTSSLLGINADMPPMACAPLLWQVFTKSCA
jgi:alginate O-acetyltransferase complex protein AlgI